VGTNGALTALVSLGPKRSRDLYTGSEIHLLRAVADRAALELQRFDARQFREESRVLHEAMRRYVPGAIAERIEHGDALEAGEREVSVLFVDVRGFTALSEGSRSQDIFSTINRYTRLVSELVRDSGGTVVEFNGDGMMAVFGAPAELPDKERAAVRAGRRIASAVGRIEHDGRSLSVGVGIATGLDFVGNIQAADRSIWSAIGVTTNLAARLQALTRDLDASLIIDAPTHAVLGDEGQRFRRLEQIAIRGLSERIDVFALGHRDLRRPAAETTTVAPPRPSLAG
jgi:adenylate cyclase